MQTTTLHTPVNSLTGLNHRAGLRPGFACGALDAPALIPAGGITGQIRLTGNVLQFCATSQRGE